MVRIRLLMIAEFGWVALMIGAGRTEPLPLLGAINPALYVYLISAVAMAVLIAYPEVAQRPIQGALLVVLVAYALFKAVESIDHVIDGAFVARVIFETAVLSITVYMGRRLSITAAHVEKSVRNSLLPSDTFAVLNEQEGEQAITEEILRARRYERPLTLIHIRIPRLQKRPFTRWSQKKVLEYEYSYVRIIQIIRNLIYDSDIIAWHGSDLVVCLPETSKDEASVLVFPLEALLTTSLQENARISMAHFPADALVYRDLLKAALAAAPALQESILPARPAAAYQQETMDLVQADTYREPSLVMSEIYYDPPLVLDEGNLASNYGSNSSPHERRL